MTHLLIRVALCLAVTLAPIPGEAAAKQIHVAAKVLEQTFTGDLKSPKVGDRIINSVELFDEAGAKVGTGAGACTIVSIQESIPATLVQCLLSAVFDKGKSFLGAWLRFQRPVL